MSMCERKARLARKVVIVLPSAHPIKVPAGHEWATSPLLLRPESGQGAAIQQLPHRSRRIRRKLTIDMKEAISGKDAAVHSRF
jgi:hypothetical protein